MARAATKLNDLARKRALKKPPIEDEHETGWLRERGLMWVSRIDIPNDREIRDAEWGEANGCAIIRRPRGITYVSFKHRKIVHIANPRES